MTIQEMTRRLDDEKREIESLLHRQMDQAVAEGRERTDSEKRDVDERMARARVLKRRLEEARGEQSLITQLDIISGGRPTRSRVDGSIVDPSTGQRMGPQSLGGQVASIVGDWYRQNRQNLPSGGAWVSPGFELSATTLDESTGSGGKLLVPDYQQGIVQLPTRRLVVADLPAQGTTDSNSVIYMKETTFTNTAAPTAEAAAKPESTLVFDNVTEPVRKIAHWLPVTEEMLEDVSALRGYLDARLRTGVQLSEDDQLLNGSGVAPNLTGFMNRAGLAAAQARGTDTNADAIAKQIAAIENATNLEVDAIIINPTNWLTILLTKDAQGQYYGDGPFASAQGASLWGKRVAITSAIAAGTALVGAFKSASQVFRNGGLRVEASNSHNDYFVKNLVAIRAEERLALAVYREPAFGKVTGLV